MLEGEDIAAVKQWLLPKLEAASTEAEPEVLADYVIALLSTEGPIETVKQAAVDALSEFLPDRAGSFIDEVATGIAKRSWAPRRGGKIAASANVNTQHVKEEPAPEASLHQVPASAGPSRYNIRENSKIAKRPHDTSDLKVEQGVRETGLAKKRRRRRCRVPMVGQPNDVPPNAFSNPRLFAAALADLSGIGFPTEPWMITPVAGFPTAWAPQSTDNTQRRLRCANYDIGGFCVMGTACPYDHSTTLTAHDACVPAYDPNRPLLVDASVDLTDSPTNPTLVVEQIPMEYLSEVQVRNFFSEFGRVADVQMQEHRRLALVMFKYREHAQLAYDSPKAIFDNRFVKVYWYNGLPSLRTVRLLTERVAPDQTIPEIYRQDDDMMDREVFEHQQAEAQKAFEERRDKKEKAAAKAVEIYKKLQTHEDKTKKLRHKLAEMTRVKGAEIPLLTESLSALQVEADRLYAKHRAYMPLVHGTGSLSGKVRGNGGYRGLGTAGRLQGSVIRLDNRPKRLGIRGVVAGSMEDNAIRSYLRNTEGCENVQMHRERPNTLVASFAERYLAEMFIDEADDIPDVGKLQLSWIPNNESVSTGSAEHEAVVIKHEADHVSKGPERRGRSKKAIEIEHDSGEDGDVDVADDTEQLL